uniref:EF-hand domain-containing protein n=1 Tax=Haptolina brevifila TaxID=156173 RepID=A0A7S2JSZ5_9EUKA
MAKAQRAIVIGAGGAVGKRLCNALSRAGTEVIAADRMNFIPSTVRFVSAQAIGGIDVRDEEALVKLFREHADEDTAVWNLASPLSVETAMSPEIAEKVVIGGMKNVLSAMKQVNARRICFTDSIGSFGATSPRDRIAASWLVDNPTQDPGSDYGKQKRACRELLNEFAVRDGGDPRIAVLPGVLHSEPVWGNGTTEYALDALLAASRNESFACPIDPDVQLPMVFVDDLMRGLLSLQFANEDELREKQRIYCIPGISFSAQQLFEEIRQFKPNFNWTLGPIHPNMDKFAKLWPDSLSTDEPLRDLDYEPDVTLPAMVAGVLNAHSGRRLSSKAAFRSIDTCSSGRVNDYMLEKYVSKYLVRGREKAGYIARRQDLVAEIVADLMLKMDVDKDGVVSMSDFMQWSNVNKLEGVVEDYYAEMVARQQQ